eukprot:TRINITY_DN2312_c0_g2_i1.p1 TRINITY_DN2312_c0_g2~~TRINITY_DN2312_c0_g2_i1.p1  ORF type:complete len:777 (+),score=286.70 TRINITY_DN2312_c0_g2_i1:69-2333(+)
MAPTGTGRNVFLSGMGLVYLCAFASYYIQYQGLFGREGLDPTRAVLGLMDKKREQLSGGFGAPGGKPVVPPLFTWGAVLHAGVDVDVWMEGLALGGVVMAALALAGVHHFAVFVYLFVAYREVFILGATYLGFQWDVLLLEAGFLCIFYRRASNAQVRWAVRLLAFKLFLMTGSVKIFSGCSTWHELTALQYHYASQCLPTPAAWWFHNLPKWFHAMSLTFVLTSQVAGAFLLVAPAVGVRRFGVALQVVNMTMIMVSGNYNWFNLHAALLCLPSWEAEWGNGKTSARPAGALIVTIAVVFGLLYARSVNDVLAIIGAILALHLDAGGGWTKLHFMGTAVAFVAAWAALYLDTSAGVAAAASTYMTRLGDPVDALTNDPLRLLSSVPLKANLDPRALGLLLGEALPVVVRYIIACVVFSGACEAFMAWVAPVKKGQARPGVVSRLYNTVYQLALTAATAFIVVNSIYPMREIYRYSSLDALGFEDIALPPWPGVRDALSAWKGGTEGWHPNAFSGYGLFRMMTGVGNRGQVAVPVVVFEIKTDQGWREVQFRYAPGAPGEAPRWNIPHQPRLDWQLWFAALSRPQQYPQLLHMVTKILRKERYVCYLLDLPCDDRSFRPVAVRAKRYHYDFTADANASDWWTRKEVEPFFPVMTLPEARKQLPDFFGAKLWTVDAQPVKPTPPLNAFWQAFTDIVRACSAGAEEYRRADGAVGLILMIASTVLALRFSRSRMKREIAQGDGKADPPAPRKAKAH